MAIKIPTIGPQGNVGGSIPLTMQPRDLTYSGLNLKSHAGDNLKLLAGAGEKFVADLTKLQVQIKKDQDDATLLDLQNKINEEDLSIFASLVDPDNENNALGVNATDARYAELVRNKKQAGNGVLSGNLQGIYADYGEQIAGLSRTSQVALKKFILTNNVSFEQKLLSHFSEQSKAYKTQALETDILSAEQALPTDATAFDANIKNLTLKIAGLLKYQGLYSVENVQTQLHEKFSVGVHDTIMGMLARGDVAGAEEFYKTYVVDDGYTVVPAGDDGTGGISAVLKGSHRTAIDNAIASATEEVAITAGFEHIQSLPDIEVGGKKIPVIDDLVNMRDHINKLKGMKINGVIITEEHIDKISTRISNYHTNQKKVYDTNQDNILLNVQTWVHDNPNKKIPQNLLAGLDIDSLNKVQKYQESYAGVKTGSKLLVSNLEGLRQNWYGLEPEQKRKMTLKELEDNVLIHADEDDAKLLTREWSRLQDSKDATNLAAIASADTEAKTQIADQHKAAFAYAEKQIATRIKLLSKVFQTAETAAARSQADMLMAQWEISIRRELHERFSSTDTAALSFAEVDGLIADYSIGFAADRSGRNIDSNWMRKIGLPSGTKLDVGTILETVDMPADWTKHGGIVEDVQKKLKPFSNSNRYEVVSLYTEFAQAKGHKPNIEDLNSYLGSFEQFLTNEMSGKNVETGNLIYNALKQSYAKQGIEFDKLDEADKRRDIMEAFTRSVRPMDIIRSNASPADIKKAGGAPFKQPIKSKANDKVKQYVGAHVAFSPAFADTDK